MKKTVWTFGLIAGGILSAVMLAAQPLQKVIGFGGSAVLGYATMVLAFLFVFFGIRSYRDTVGQGVIDFWRALVVGALIVVIASVCYTVTWEVIYKWITPDFVTRYEQYEVDKARASGANQAEVAKEIADAHRFIEMYRNPVMNTAVTFLEPLPIGLVLALVSAGILKRRRPTDVERFDGASVAALP
jgi:hypothetical protein